MLVEEEGLRMKDVISEKAILSGICKYGLAGLNEVGDLVGEEHFTDISNKAIFSTSIKILEKQDHMDVASLLGMASTLSLSGVMQDNDYINDLFTFPVDIDSLRTFGTKLRTVKVINDAMAVTKETADSLRKCTGEETLDEISALLEKPITEFAMEGDAEETTELYGNVEEYVDFLANNPCDYVGVSTGFRRIDAAMGGGTRRGSITLWGCRTGGGKSLMAGMISRYNAKKGIPVLVLDTEMSSDDQMSRSLAAMSGVDLSKIEKGAFSDELDRVKLAAKELKEYPIYFRSVAGKDFSEILSVCRRWILKEVGFTDGRTNECLIIYDYFKLMDSGQLNNVQEYQALGFQITDLNNFCIKYDIPVHSFVQTNRDDAVSQSDRLQWLASSVAIFSNKTDEEIVSDGAENGNMIFKSIKNRFGPGLLPWDAIMMQKTGKLATIKEVCSREEMKARKAEDDDTEV